MTILEIIPSQSGVRQIPCRKSYLILKRKNVMSTADKSIYANHLNHQE
jgi:hypothetical protein